MRRLISAAIAVLFFFAPAFAYAGNRVVIYSGQVPSSTESNQQARFNRLSYGTWMRDELGSNLSAGGIYTNLSVIPNGGMYVAIQPTTTNSLGALYQIAVDDSNPVPTSQTGNQLSSDPTKIIIQATQSGPSGSLGPIVAPATGLSQYYLVEAQVQTVDATPQSLTFVSSTGSTSTQTVNTQRIDQIVYQLKAGTAAASPTIPTVDTSWIAIGTVLVPSGTATVTSGMIAAEPAFSGFVANGSNVTLSGLTLSGASAGCLQVTTSGQPISSQPCTSGLGTVNGTSPIQATTSGGIATVTCPTCVTNVAATGNLSSTLGTTPTISISANPSFTSVTGGSATWNGNSTIPNSCIATSSANCAAYGAFQVQSSTWNSTAAVLHTWGVTSDSNAKLSFKFDSTPKLTLDQNGNVTATTFTGSASGLTNLPLNQFSGLTANTCIRASATTTIASASGDCLTGLTAGTGISVGTGTTPSVGIANNGVGQTQVLNGYVDLSSTQTIGGSKTFSNTLTVNGGTWDGAKITSSSSAGFILNSGSTTSAISMHKGDGSADTGFKVFDGGTTNYAQINYGSGLLDQLSSYGPTGATVNGTVTGTSSLWDGGNVAISALSAPAAPTLSQTSGGTIGATTYYERSTYVNANGQTVGSTETSLAVSANNVLVVPSPTTPVPGNATGWNVFVSTSTGTETKQNTSTIALGTSWTEPTSGLIAGSALPTSNTTGGSVIAGPSTYGPSSATVAGDIFGSGRLYVDNIAGSPGGNYGIHAGNGTVSAVLQSHTNATNPAIIMDAFNQTSSAGNTSFEVTRNGLATVLMTVTDAGNVTATNFFNGSKRAWKTDITPFNFDALATVNGLNLYSYCYRDTTQVNGKIVYLDRPSPDCARNGKKVGYMADDPTTPIQLAGKQHDHFDAGALATFDAAAIKQEDAKVNALSARLDALSFRADGLELMVRRLCREKKNRREAVCRAFAR